jgi:hypothetical protein
MQPSMQVSFIGFVNTNCGPIPGMGLNQNNYLIQPSACYSNVNEHF